MKARHPVSAYGTTLQALGGVCSAVLVLAGARAALASQTTAPPSSVAGPAVAASLPAAGDLNTAALLALAQLSENFKPDGFSANPANAYAGRSFVVELEKPSFSYSPDDKVLTVSSGPSNWIITQGKTSTSYAEGQNSFGVKRVVQTNNYRKVEIKSQDYPLPIARLLKDQMHYAIHLPLEPEAARDLSSHLAWLVAGKLIRAKRFDGQLTNVVSVEDGALLATVAVPVTTISHTLDLNAIISNVSLIDARSGKVLSSEDLPPCPVANAMQAAECAASQRAASKHGS